LSVGALETSATVNTNGAGAVTIIAWPVPINTTYLVRASVAGRRTDGTPGRAAYELVACFYRDGGAAAQQGVTATLATFESTAAYDAVLDLSGNTMRLRVTGAVGHMLTWNAVLRLTPAI
jgi:hypothetical protein